MNLEDLKKEMPYKWRVQEAKEHGANCVAYVDARDVMNRLDEVVGMGMWQSKYESHNGNIYCSIGIKVDNEWVWKTDCGSESNVEKEKGEASDALKRSAVQWGVGRFLYDLPIKKLKTKEKNGKWYPIDGNGNMIFSKEALTEFINSSQTPAKPTPKVSITPDKVDGLVKWMKENKKGMVEVKGLYDISADIEKQINDKLKA